MVSTWQVLKHNLQFSRQTSSLPSWSTFAPLRLLRKPLWSRNCTDLNEFLVWNGFNHIVRFLFFENFHWNGYWYHNKTKLYCHTSKQISFIFSSQPSFSGSLACQWLLCKAGHQKLQRLWNLTSTLNQTFEAAQLISSILLNISKERMSWDSASLLKADKDKDLGFAESVLWTLGCFHPNQTSVLAQKPNWVRRELIELNN